MAFNAILKAAEKDIFDEWFDRFCSTYGPDTMWRFKNSTDPFHNPVGVNTRKSLSELLGLLLHGGSLESAAGVIDPIVRIRAIQKFTASQAVAFFIELKDIVHKLLKKKDLETYAADLYTFDSQVDTLMLLAFDAYTLCREEISRLRVDTERKKIYKAFSRAGLLDITEEEKALLEED